MDKQFWKKHLRRGLLIFLAVKTIMGLQNVIFPKPTIKETKVSTRLETIYSIESESFNILDKRDIAGDTAAVQNDRLDLTNVFCDDEGRLPLEDAKRLVLKNLRILEVRHCLRVGLFMY